MWLAHYSFHLLTTYDTIIPATQALVADRGWNVLGAPLWQRACCRPAADWIPHLEILMLDLRLVAVAIHGFRIAETNTKQVSQAMKTFAPWALLILLLFTCGVWIVFSQWKCAAPCRPRLSNSSSGDGPRHEIVLIIWVFWSLLVGSCCAVASADSGRVVLVERMGDYQNFRLHFARAAAAGLVDISVLLQDSATGQPITVRR